MLTSVKSTKLQVTMANKRLSKVVKVYPLGNAAVLNHTISTFFVLDFLIWTNVLNVLFADVPYV